MKNDNSSSGESILISKDGDGTDVVSVWFQMEVLQESRMMIPDCHRRLAIAHADLLQLLETEEDLTESEEYKEARNVLDSVKLEG
ncbi:tubulin-specific chaperone A [Lates japonicus]|uniref:Tubulin-specific chaperone A n=1 Tax=Lates japonicus TaxID=270547 RepID=A0AAD3MD63_LATJO|nr:tubulin-specific chaperone A [Lates japonicus]